MCTYGAAVGRGVWGEGLWEVCGKDTFSASVRPDLGVSEAKRSV